MFSAVQKEQQGRVRPRARWKTRRPDGGRRSIRGAVDRRGGPRGGEACVNARRLGLIPRIFSGPGPGSGDGGRLRADGRGVEGSCLPVAGISSGK